MDNSDYYNIGWFFIKNISENKPFNKQILKNIIDLSFSHYRSDYEKWNVDFNKGLSESYLKYCKKYPYSLENIKSIFNFESLLLEPIHLDKTLKIIQNKKINYTYFSDNQDCNLFNYSLNYKRYILTKHYYSLIHYFNKISNINNQNSLLNIFKSINSISLTGDLFSFIDNKVILNFHNNQHAVFLLYTNNKLYGIDVSLSDKFNSLVFYKHFINLHFIYSKEKKDIIGKLSQNKSYNTTYKKIKELLNEDIVYIISFDNEPEYDRLTFEDSIVLNLIALEKNNSHFNQLFFIETIDNLDYNIERFLNKKEEWISLFIQSYQDNEIKNYLNSIYPDSHSNTDSIYNLIESKLISKFKNKENNFEQTFKNFLSEIGVFEADNINSFYKNFLSKKLDFQNKDIYNIQNRLIEEKKEEILKNSISKEEKEELLKELGIKNTSNSNKLFNKKNKF